jgi:HK97 family phage portal protein
MIAPNRRMLWVPEDFSDAESRPILFDNGATRTVLWDNDAGRFLESSAGKYSGVKIDRHESMRSTVYLGCLRIVAETLANLPLQVIQHTPEGERVADEHWLHRLFIHGVNPRQSTWEWVSQMVLHIFTGGQAFNEKVFSVNSELGLEPPRVMALEPREPWTMTCAKLDSGRLGYVWRDENGRQHFYEQKQIAHFRWLSMDGVNGLVPHELAEDALGLARACEIHGAAYFGNGARPGIILSTDTDDLSQEARDEIRYTWERVHRGPSRSHRPAVLTGGLKPIPFEGNNADSQFLETRKFQCEEVCRLCGVPPHLVGILDRATNNNIEQQGLDFLTYSMMAWCRRFETTMDRDLLTRADRDAGFCVKFDTDALMRGDAAARSSYYHTGLQDGWLSVNEVRRRESMNRVEGGDQRFVQLNMQTLEQAAANALATAAKNTPLASGVSGLLDILARVGEGKLSKASAVELIVLAYPPMTREQASSVVLGAAEAPAPAAAPAALPAPETPRQGSPDVQPPGVTS